MDSKKIPLNRARLYAISYVVFGAILAFVMIQNARAQTALSFGGPIIGVQECGCSGGWMIIVGPPTPGFYVFQFGVSQLFLAGQIFRTGPQVLGTYSPGGVCVPGGSICLASIPANTIITVGTSL